MKITADDLFECKIIGMKAKTFTKVHKLRSVCLKLKFACQIRFDAVQIYEKNSFWFDFFFFFVEIDTL